MEQRRAISMQTYQEVDAVCANPSFSVAQKQQRIREIHQQERLQLDGLICRRSAKRCMFANRSTGAEGAGSHRFNEAEDESAQKY
jgi:hypothetical protein